MTCPGESDQNSRRSKRDAWLSLRGALKDVFAELGGGEAYLRQERESFNEAAERREALIVDAFRKK